MTNSAEELVGAAHQHDLPVIEDLGSGILFDLSEYELPSEPTVKEGIEADPLMRALRVDKMTLAALEETLKLYYNFEEAVEKIPTLRLITEKTEKVKARAEELQALIKPRVGAEIEIIESEAKVGGGAYPLSSFKSYALAVDTGELSTEKFVYKLRQLKTPVISRIQNERAIFDLKTVSEQRLNELAHAINKVLAEVF